MKFMQKFKNLFFLFLISFLGQIFVFKTSFAMERDDLKEQDWRQTYKKFYKISLKRNRSQEDVDFLSACAQLVYDDGDTLLHKILTFVEIDGNNHTLRKKKFVTHHFLDNGANIDDRDEQSNNVLHRLAMRNTPSKMIGFKPRDNFYSPYNRKKEQTLFSPFKRRGQLSNDDVNAQNNMGATPLHVATSLANYNTAIIKILLRHRADPKIRDRNGRTVLHRLVSNKDISEEVKILNLNVLLKNYPREKWGELARIRDNKENRAMDFAKFYHGEGSKIFQLIKQMDARLRPKKVVWSSYS